MSTKEQNKRSQQETEKLLESIAVKQTDERLKKSIDDYKQMIKRKDMRNQ